MKELQNKPSEKMRGAKTNALQALQRNQFASNFGKKSNFILPWKFNGIIVLLGLRIIGCFFCPRQEFSKPKNLPTMIIYNIHVQEAILCNITKKVLCLVLIIFVFPLLTKNVYMFHGVHTQNLMYMLF